MNKIWIVILLFLFSRSALIGGSTPLIYQSKICKGISFHFDKDQVAEYDIYKGFIFTSVEEIRKQLDYNLDTMWQTFLTISAADPNRFPSCLNQALTKLHDDLCNGNKNILIKWNLEASDWFNVHLQNQFGSVLGSNPTSGIIELVDIYRPQFIDRGLCKTMNPGRSMTAAVLFHEFIHCVKKRYPDCFAKLDHGMEELTTQCCEIGLFGFENATSHYFEKMRKTIPANGWCNFKNVCQCGQNCPEENPSSECDCCCKK